MTEGVSNQFLVEANLYGEIHICFCNFGWSSGIDGQHYLDARIFFEPW